LNYDISEAILHNSNLKIRLLAERYDLPVEPGVIIPQTPQAGEFVDHGTYVGVTISKGPSTKKQSFLDLRAHVLEQESKKLAVCEE
jgi:beta-lactam-binding protein with PASTA domain